MIDSRHLGRFSAAFSGKLAYLATALLIAIAVAMTGCSSGGSSSSSGTSGGSLPPSVTVSVSPASANVLLGNTQQFNATVTGSSNTTVTWAVNGVAGGNSTVGTITTGGLYTAPQDLPNPASVTVAATSQASSTASGSSAGIRAKLIGHFDQPVYVTGPRRSGGGPVGGEEPGRDPSVGRPR